MDFPRTLKTLVATGQIVPVTGLGVSLSVRRKNGASLVPTWGDLLHLAVRRLEEEHRMDAAQKLRIQLDGILNYADSFRTARMALGTVWDDFLKEQYDPAREDAVDESLALARAVWKLSNGLVVTTTHDQVLKWACPDQPRLITSSEISNVLQSANTDRKSPTLYHVYGTVGGGNAIFTLDGVRSLLPEHAGSMMLYQARHSLANLFAGPHVVVFIGTALPREIERSFFTNSSSSQVTHYWLVRESDISAAKQFIAQYDLSIQVVAYPSYSELPSFVEQLATYGTESSLTFSQPKSTISRIPEIVESNHPMQRLSTPAPSAPIATETAKSESKISIVEKTSPADIVIVCALHKPELEKVLQTKGAGTWKTLPALKSDPTTYHSTKYTTRRGAELTVVAASPTQMGLPASAVLTTKLILRFQPKMVAMVGIAAGVKIDKQGFGDILAADCTFDYGSGKIETKNGRQRFLPNPQPIPILTRLSDRLKHWSADRRELDAIYRAWTAQKPNTALQLHVGPLGSGASVINHRKPIADITAHWRKLIGIEMEAYAVHCACRDTIQPSPAFLCLKSICDFAIDKEDGWQDYSAFTAAEFCYRFLVEEWEDLYLT